MPVTYSIEGGRTGARLSGESDGQLFERMANLIAKEFHGRWVEKLDGLGQRYWDVEIGGIKLTLHSEHCLGISLFPAKGYERDSAANRLVREVGAFLEATAA
jgi:hypothetical protein